jgi:hypothetical protein
MSCEKCGCAFPSYSHDCEANADPRDAEIARLTADLDAALRIVEACKAWRERVDSMSNDIVWTRRQVIEEYDSILSGRRPVAK